MANAPGYSFDPFKGIVADTANPSIYDVKRRQDLAQTLLANKVPYEANASPLGALADALAGTASGFENTQAAGEAQSGQDQTNAALAQALQGGDVNAPALMQASGSGFMNPGQADIATALMKKKYGLGETFFGSPTAATDSQGNVHYYQLGSMGDTREVNPGQGQTWAPKVQWLDQGNQFTAAPTIAGAVPAATPNAPTSLPINNAQASSDKTFGSAIGTQFGNATPSLQSEGNLLQTLDQQHAKVSDTVDKALSQIGSGVFSTGTVGNLLSAVPGTPQYDLAQNLETIKANVGFDTLQAMRSNSPTGGALGQISDMEEKLLQAVNGSLQQGQSAEQLKSNLVQVRDLMSQVNALKHQQYQQDVARFSSAAPAAPVVGGPGAVPLAPRQAPTGKVLTYNAATGQLE